MSKTKKWFDHGLFTDMLHALNKRAGQAKQIIVGRLLTKTI